jgi:predicted heme/steroid binding protein
LILLAGSALTFALFGSGVAVAQARKGAETIQTSQDLSAAPLPGGSHSGDGPLGFVWNLVAVGDFNGDSKPDYVLFNFITRQTAIWYMNNNIFVGGAFGPTLPSNWFLEGVADFNGDSKPDYVLVTGFGFTSETAIWYMNNNVFVSGAFGPTLPENWNVRGVADFNGDSKPDYVLGNATTGQTAIWYMNNNIFVSGAFGPTLPDGWFLEGVADFNGDSKPDYVLFNFITRQTAIWYMNNNVFVSGAFGPTLPP